MRQNDMVTVLASPWLATDEDVERPFDAVECVLAVRAKEGDKRAQRAIYERHAPGVRRFVADLLRDRDAASDAFQDTFVRVFQKIGALEDPSRLVGWVFGIARRVCLEHRRAAFRRGRRIDSSEHGENVPHHGPSPEAVVSFAESAARLERALDQLGEDRRAVLLLRCDHLLSYEEIATAMGFSVAKVKIEIHRARATLRAALQEDAT